VEIDDQRKVKLIGLDGKTLETADRLIFLISKQDITAQALRSEYSAKPNFR
jgi:chaperone required for assembly of F1-ATPase